MIFHTLDVSTPKAGLIVYTNSYWMCIDGDPKKALFYGTSPQCNQDKRLAQLGIKKKMYTDFHPNIQVVFIETAFIPQRN